jgi:hypothetical protein
MVFKVAYSLTVAYFNLVAHGNGTVFKILPAIYGIGTVENTCHCIYAVSQKKRLKVHQCGCMHDY